jgi:hypothetical protein
MGSAGPIYDKSMPQMERKCQGRVVAYLLSEDKKGDNNKSIKEKIQKGDNYNTVVAFHAT